MSKTAETKTWTRPQLVRLGTIGDVAGSNITGCQVFKGQSSNCQTNS
jgi:hypothetical protein